MSAEARVQILHVEGCPNVVRAREVVRRALAEAGLSGSVRVEEMVGDFASPTVLVDGEDVTGQTPAMHGSCRLDLPTEAQVTAALRREVTPTVACTLSGADLRSQFERWQSLWVAAGLQRARTDDGVRLTFRDEATVASERQSLVTAENECCSWASWEVSREDGALSMRARSRGPGSLALQGMFDAGSLLSEPRD